VNFSFSASVKNTLGISLPSNYVLKELNKDLIVIEPNNLYILLYPYFTGINNQALFSNDIKKQCIHVYQDQWINRSEIVISRIKNALGLSQKIGARSCIVKKIDTKIASDFFEEHHLSGASKAAHTIGLYNKDNLCLAASFSKSRVMIDGEVYYRSYELIRFASAKNILVVGGLQKILNHFILFKNVVHLMTYIDLNFGDGKGFEKFGFKKIGSAKMLSFYVNPNTNERMSAKTYESLQNIDFEPIVIKANCTQKMVLDLR
jgi:hypothetical protein